MAAITSLQRFAGLLFLLLVTFVAAPLFAQTAMGTGQSASSDTAIVFTPSRPLIETKAEQFKEYQNSFGFNATFSDYGFGGGTFISHTFSQEFTAELSLDVGTAKGPKELGLDDEEKINRIFVLPLMLSAQYRLFQNSLSDNLRPYATVGAGAVLVATTPAQEDFLPAFHHGFSKTVPGGFFGLGANFGMDPKSTFGASVRYFIIPYPGGVQSTTTQTLDNLNALYLTVNYAFNF